MMSFLSRLMSFPTFKNTKGVTVPPMDGALKPNQALEAASMRFLVEQPDNLVRDGDNLLFSSGCVLMSCRAGITDGTSQEVARFETEITAVACDGEGGYAIGLDDGEIVFAGKRAHQSSIRVTGVPLSPTSMTFGDKGQLFVCSGSAHNKPSDWKRDLMERNESGSIWMFDLASGRSSCLATGLAFPYGIIFVRNEKALLISESWKHRLVLLKGLGGQSKSTIHPVLDDLPGYPARISAGSSGYWLTIFAPRSQLMEFVLREDDYRQRMIDTIDQRFWTAPTLSSGRSFQEPMQLGALRVMGALKPWAPTRSYGLVVHLGDDFQPLGSAHSRSDGKRHGVTSCIEWEEHIWVASKGGNEVLSLLKADIAED